MVKPVSESTPQAEPAPSLEQLFAGPKVWKLVQDQDAKDAARYRWLRGNTKHWQERGIARYGYLSTAVECLGGKKLDAAIDAAMSTNSDTP